MWLFGSWLVGQRKTHYTVYGSTLTHCGRSFSWLLSKHLWDERMVHVCHPRKTLHAPVWVAGADMPMLWSFSYLSVLISAITCLLCELHLTLWLEAMDPAALLDYGCFQMRTKSPHSLNRSMEPHSPCCVHPQRIPGKHHTTNFLSEILMSIELIALGYFCKNTPHSSILEW